MLCTSFIWWYSFRSIIWKWCSSGSSLLLLVTNYDCIQYRTRSTCAGCVYTDINAIELRLHPLHRPFDTIFLPHVYLQCCCLEILPLGLQTALFSIVLWHSLESRLCTQERMHRVRKDPGPLSAKCRCLVPVGIWPRGILEARNTSANDKWYAANLHCIPSFETE